MMVTLEEIKMEKINENKMTEEFLVSFFDEELGWCYDSVTVLKKRNRNVKMYCKCGEILKKKNDKIYCDSCGFDNSKKLTCSRCKSQRSVAIEKNLIKCIDCGKITENFVKDRIERKLSEYKISLIELKNDLEEKIKILKKKLSEKTEKFREKFSKKIAELKKNFYKKKSEKLYDKADKIYRKTKAVRQKWFDMIVPSIF